MVKREHIVLPIEGNKGKYIVTPRKDGALVYIATPRRIFNSHYDIFKAFKDAQDKSPEDVIQFYERLDDYFKGKLPGHKACNIRSRRNLIQALEECAHMPALIDAPLGGGWFSLDAGVLLLHKSSDTYGPVDKAVLERFRNPLKECYALMDKPLITIVIK